MSKPDELNPKQSRFVDEYLIDLNGKQAAIRAGYSAATAEVQASRLLSHVKVKLEVDKRQKKAQERAEVTLDNIIQELDENRKAALDAEVVQSSAATAATIAKAKLLGFVVEKQETKHSGTVTHAVAEAPKFSKEEWLEAHGLGTAARSAK